MYWGLPEPPVHPGGGVLGRGSDGAGLRGGHGEGGAQAGLRAALLLGAALGRGGAGAASRSGPWDRRGSGPGDRSGSGPGDYSGSGPRSRRGSGPGG